MNDTFKKVLLDIVKYAVSALLGAFGFASISGCVAF